MKMSMRAAGVMALVLAGGAAHGAGTMWAVEMAARVSVCGVRGEATANGRFRRT